MRRKGKRRRVEWERLSPEPDRERENKGEAGAIAEKVEFVELPRTRSRGYTVCFCTSGFIEELFRENVLGNEDDRSAKRTHDAEKIAGKLDATCQHHPKGERDQRKIGGCCVLYMIDEAVGEYCE